MRFLPLRCALLAGLAIVLLPGPGRLFALDPHKELTQYTHTVWTRAQGLPQDTIRALAQTSDGYLWVGTNEGLARFDGYDFVTFTKGKGALPSQRIRKLWAGRDGNLWIGTMRGLVLYSGGVFKTFTAKDGLPPGKIDALIEDHSGTVWVISGENLYYLDKGKFVTYPKQRLALVGHPQVLYEDAGHQLWVASAESVLKRTEDGFAVVLGAGQLRGNTVTSLLKDSMGLWVGSTQGLLLLKDGGSMSHFTMRDGLPNNFVQTLHKDRAGNLWVGTYGGLSRFEGGRFTSPGPDQRQDLGWILCMYEDHEGDLWLGMNSALIRLSDSRFSMYGLPEGLPSDESNVVHRDSRDELWVGYHSSGLVALKSRKRFTIRDGLPSNEIFGIRGARNGDLLISTRNGLSRMHQGRFTNYSVPDPLGRSGVYSALEDIYGRLWAANASGVYEFEQGAWRAVVLDRSNTNNVTVTLAEGPDGTIWAGSLGSGLVEIQNTASGTGKIRRFTESDGLGTDEIRSLYAERDGTLWIGTLDGGMIEFRNGVFHRYTAGDGLLSDNVSHVQDDGRGSLWLSTTRGISRISKQQLRDFSAGKIRALQPENFGTADGLRSAQCGPGAPAGSGSVQTSDGRLWFPTSAGVASIDPQSTGRQNLQSAPPAVHITGIFADGRTLDLEQAAKLEPDTGNIEFHYTGIHLSAPERVQYSYKLEGLDRDWVQAGPRRVIEYSQVPHGSYRFLVKAVLPNGQVGESQFAFEVLPQFFETRWFFWFCALLLAGAIYGAYRMRLDRVHAQFALVSAERARMAREIHDTLAQGFVGISAQLDALAVNWKRDPKEAWQHLDLARRMARHSLTEARRSVLDLRATELEEMDLPAALAAAARRCTLGNPVQLQMEVQEIPRNLAADLEQNLLRIVQEAVTNVVKHAKARTIQIELAAKERLLHLRIKDDGQGFEPSSAFSVLGGHFGILGMRERAERMGGEFALSSRPGTGTELQITVPFVEKSAS